MPKVDGSNTDQTTVTAIILGANEADNTNVYQAASRVGVEVWPVSSDNDARYFALAQLEAVYLEYRERYSRYPDAAETATAYRDAEAQAKRAFKAGGELLQLTITCAPQVTADEGLQGFNTHLALLRKKRGAPDYLAQAALQVGPITGRWHY